MVHKNIFRFSTSLQQFIAETDLQDFTAEDREIVLLLLLGK